MDPFVADILKRAAVIGLGAFAVAFALFAGYQLVALSHALTLNSWPGQIDS